ncbi:glycosyl transferase family 2 [Terrihabitans soli]|uniref:Glycosyl transferase family 2 n=1 Tax=Terrihabitans soli TaxID=708113 RepID=A0A6S6QSY3_9HYPH|nr:glycosyltransferase family A protein [Terrihabitans soli]BCJ92209.1 glycosyl transferase family 2 [Terrihabitans soli]
MWPDYSVIIPVFNGASTIAETIQSVVAQTVPPKEIIVVDDGSSDGTGEIASAASPLVRVVRQENAGCGAATNRGMDEVSCAVLAMVDADDLFTPEKMETQLRHLAANPDCHGVFCHMRTFRTDGVEAGSNKLTPGWSRSTIVIHSAAARKVGPVIDPPGSRGDMIDWIGRAKEIGLRFDMLDEVMLLRRVHPGSMSYGRDDNKDRGYLHVAWLAMQRRKAQGQ